MKGTPSNDNVSNVSNPFATLDRATIAAAVQRLNKVCPLRSSEDTTEPVRARARDVLKRTSRTRYILLTHNPLKGRHAHRYADLDQAIALVGGLERLNLAVASGYVPIVAAEGAAFAFRRTDIAMLRNAYGSSPLPTRTAPEPRSYVRRSG